MGYWQSADTPGLVPTLDRVVASKGYVAGNIQVVTRSQNSEKSNKERFLPAHVQDMLRRKREMQQDKLEKLNRAMYGDPDDPF